MMGKILQKKKMGSSSFLPLFVYLKTSLGAPIKIYVVTTNTPYSQYKKVSISLTKRKNNTRNRVNYDYIPETHILMAPIKVT